MYYFFNQAILDEKKLMNFTGTMYCGNKKLEGDIFRAGKLINEADFEKKITVIVDESDSSYKKKTLTDRIILDVVDMGSLLLVSSKLVTLIKKSEVTNVQFFEVKIKASNFELIEYYLMNVIGKIDCMDEDKSEIRYRSNGKILHLENLVLDNSKIPENLQIFLLDRFTAAVILIREDLKQVMEKAGLTGIEYKILDRR